MTIRDALHAVVTHRASLDRKEARTVMEQILSGGATDAQIAALLVALHMKGESVEEIVGFAEAIRAAALPFGPRAGSQPIAGPADAIISGTGREALVDTCGTGGDVSGTFNISTATALTVAGAGVRVAKHGNRSVTSLCGSADVVEALGVNINMPPEYASACLNQVGIAFLYAPAMHTAMKYVQPARRDLKLRTIFNLLGPLTNPAGADAQVVGVYAEPLVEKLAAALRLLGLKRALVVHGNDGLDEITITGPTKVAEVRHAQLMLYKVTPEQFGLQRAHLEDITGGTVAENTQIIRDILDGKKGARRDIVLLNAAAALVAAGKVPSMGEGLPLVADSLDSGAAKKKLAALVEFTNNHK
jgi:anthranilate phosphoribosyltransferase